MAVFDGYGRYGAIYADPPWSFKTWSGKTGTPHRGAHDHYAVQGQDWLKELPIGDIAANDCALFMWVVDSHLDQAIDLIRAWDFQYTTRSFTWVKTTKPREFFGLTLPGDPRIGMGYACPTGERRETEAGEKADVLRITTPLERAEWSALEEAA